MPKKTKKQKILAQARRIIQNAAQSEISVPSQPEIPKTSIPKIEFSYDQKRIQVQKKSDDIGSNPHFGLIKKDILKILIFSAIALAGEFVLYLRFG